MKINVIVSIHDEYFDMDVPDEADADEIDELIRIEFFNMIRESPTTLSIQTDW